MGLVVQVALGFVMAEPVVATNDDLSKLFFECKDYVVATCQGDAWTDKLDDLCQVRTIINYMHMLTTLYKY